MENSEKAKSLVRLAKRLAQAREKKPKKRGPPRTLPAKLEPLAQPLKKFIEERIESVSPKPRNLNNVKLWLCANPDFKKHPQLGHLSKVPYSTHLEKLLTHLHRNELSNLPFFKTGLEIPPEKVDAICQAWRARDPTLSVTKVWEAIGKAHGVSASGVKHSLMRKGEYKQIRKNIRRNK